MIKVKVNLHHSHKSGKIFGYVHDFCNWKVRENKTKTVILANIFFGFHMFFFFKGFQATAWATKDINLCGNNLTHINFATTSGGEIKCIETIKYYRKSLTQLASTLSNEEKNEVKK